MSSKGFRNQFKNTRRQTRIERGRTAGPAKPKPSRLLSGRGSARKRGGRPA